MLDSTAVSLCMDNDLPIVVFDMNQPDNRPVGVPGGGRGAARTSLERGLTVDRYSFPRLPGLALLRD